MWYPTYREGQSLWLRQAMNIRDRQTGHIIARYDADTEVIVATVHPLSNRGLLLTVHMPDARRVYINAAWFIDESPGSRALTETERAAHDRDEIVNGGYGY